MEAFLLSLIVVGGVIGITCAEDWRLLPLLRVYMLLVSGGLPHMKMMTDKLGHLRWLWTRRPVGRDLGDLVSECQR